MPLGWLVWTFDMIEAVDFATTWDFKNQNSKTKDIRFNGK